MEMRLVTFAVKNEEHIGAVIAGDKIVVDLAAADKALARSEKRKANAFFGDMMALLEAGSKGMSAARKAVNAAEKKLTKADGKVTHNLSRVSLRAPNPRPRKLFCLAGNYQDHLEEGGGKMVAADYETPYIFMKPPTTTVIGPGANILINPIAQSVDWEGELCVVMGRKAKAVKAGEALRYVAGYTIMNDVSERKLEVKKRSDPRPKDSWFDWLNGKWLDTFAPQGPWIVTTDDIPNPQTLDISTYINGERKQHNNTSQMLTPVANIIEYVSAFITLEPADMISTGTISGVGATTGTYMKKGDVVEVEISQIGVLRNKVSTSRK